MARHQEPEQDLPDGNASSRFSWLAHSGIVRTTAGYFLLPVITFLSPLLAVPALIRTGGAAGWSAIAIGQGLGTTAAGVVTYGWNTVGPAEVARATLQDQRHLYWVSCLMRSGLIVLTLPVAAFLTAVLVPQAFVLAAVTTCAGFAWQGLSPSWFLVGQARPLALTVLDTLPRTVGVFLAAGLVIASHDLLAYAAVTLLVEVGISWVSFGTLAQRSTTRRNCARETFSRLKEQWPLAVSSILTAGYTRLAVPIVSAVSFPSVATYAALDRVGNLSRSGLRPFINAFQAWVAKGTGPEFVRRARRASQVTWGVGLIGAVFIAVTLPLAGSVLFTRAIHISPLAAGLTALGVLCVAGSSATSLYYLVPAGDFRTVSASTIVASLTGVPAIVVLTMRGGSTGAIAGVVASEVLVILWQGVAVSRLNDHGDLASACAPDGATVAAEPSPSPALPSDR